MGSDHRDLWFVMWFVVDVLAAFLRARVFPPPAGGADGFLTTVRDREQAEEDGEGDEDGAEGRVHRAVEGAREVVRCGGAFGGHARGRG